MKFELENIFKDGIEEEWDKYVNEIIKEYTICTYDVDDGDLEVWCYDDDLATRFSDFGIGIGKTVHMAKQFNFNDDYEPVGLDYDDYIETVELHQNGNTYLCKTYCANNGCGADYAFALFDIEKVKGE